MLCSGSIIELATKLRSDARAELIAHEVVEESGLVPEKAHEHATVARWLELRCPIEDLAKALAHLVFQHPIVMITSDPFKAPGQHALKRALKGGEIRPKDGLVRQPAKVVDQAEGEVVESADEVALMLRLALQVDACKVC